MTGTAPQELISGSATQQASWIRNRKVSSVELLQAHLDQISRVNPQLNAAIAVFAETAFRQARAADEQTARGEAKGPLHGVPFSIKDSLELAGTICTAGSWGRRGAPRSSTDAAVVARLRAAGAVPIAKTNLPDLLFAFESDNLLFGATKNPYDPARTSGGSSGGEAALIAACGTPCGLGSDAAGSVRVPAAFCGIAAIKPTSGRLPRTGHFPPAGGWIETLWQIGPIARHVEDLCLILPLLAGGDGVDHSVIDMPLLDPRSVSLRELRVAFYTDNGFAPAGPEVSRVVRSAANELEAAGASVEEARPACLADAYDLEMKFLGPDGGDSLRAYLRQLGSDRLHPLLTAWLDKLERYRTDVPGFAGYWAELECYRAEMFAFLNRFDVILCPAYTQPALPHGASILDENFRGFSHTMAYNLTGWPAGVVRAGASADGLPIAVQVVARPHREDIVLAAALQLESALGGWKSPGSIS
ncbi:MAG TPA: amidase [Bryobacteraceae bacterium]|nr:amidase [Bryobacteraceae bacterium]